MVPKYQLCGVSVHFSPAYHDPLSQYSNVERVSSPAPGFLSCEFIERDQNYFEW